MTNLDSLFTYLIEFEDNLDYLEYKYCSGCLYNYFNL